MWCVGKDMYRMSLGRDLTMVEVGSVGRRNAHGEVKA